MERLTYPITVRQYLRWLTQLLVRYAGFALFGVLVCILTFAFREIVAVFWLAALLGIIATIFLAVYSLVIRGMFSRGWHNGDQRKSLSEILHFEYRLTMRKHRLKDKESDQQDTR